MIYWWFWGYKTFTGPQANFTVKSTKTADSGATEDLDEKLEK